MVNVSTIVASAFIGAVATGIVTLLVRELRGVLKIQRRRERFRESLIGEITAGRNNAASAEVVTQASGGMIPTSVFDSDTSKLGLLTESEIESITSYYASADKLNAISHRLALNPEEGYDPGSQSETQLADAYYSERDCIMDKAEEAISKLEENKSEVGLTYYVIGIFNS